MKLVGDPDGIAALKQLNETRQESVRFFINEAKTNTDYTATFRGADEVKYKIVYDPSTDELRLEKALEEA